MRPGEQIGPYRILRELGAGGMGVVYLGQHQLLGRLVAIKLLLAELTSNEEMAGRFFNEARTTALLKHPGLVDVIDFGRLPDGRAYLIMEYLEGQTLAALIEARGALGVELAVGLTCQIAGGVGAAHAKGIVHRDLKPDNVFIVRDDDIELGVRARVLDFGVAKLAPELAGGGMHTRTGILLGTPMYMAPEQCRGAGTVDWRSDIYALGCILFEMLTGRRVFALEGAGEVIGAHLHAPPPRPSALEPRIPAWLDAVILKALAKSADSRWQTMEELAAALGKRRNPSLRPSESATILTGVPSTFGGSAGEVVSRRRAAATPIFAAVVVAALAAGGVMIARQRDGGGPTTAAAAQPAAPVAVPREAAPPVVPPPAPVPAPDAGVEPPRAETPPEIVPPPPARAKVPPRRPRATASTPPAEPKAVSSDTLDPF